MFTCKTLHREEMLYDKLLIAQLKLNSICLARYSQIAPLANPANIIVCLTTNYFKLSF
jgi:hypothetical protein